MRAQTKILAGLLVAVTAGWLAGCNGTIDDADSAPVVLEVENVQIPPVNSTTDPLNPGSCVATITNSTATFKNKPKNAVAGTSPFNDILLQNVVVTYAWDDGLGAVGPDTFGVGGSVPASGSATGQFAVVNAGDLAGRDGHTANLVMVFHGVTVAGDPVSVTTGGSLVVNNCQ